MKKLIAVPVLALACALVAGAVTAAPPEHESGSGRDHVKIYIDRGADPEAKKLGAYVLKVWSCDPDQDRHFVDTANEVDIQCFRNKEGSQLVRCGTNSNLAFRLDYCSIFGRFIMSTNGRTSFPVKNISPGDVVRVEWGD